MYKDWILLKFFFFNYRYKGEVIYNCFFKIVFDYVEFLLDGFRVKWDMNMKKIEILKWIEIVGEFFEN